MQDARRRHPSATAILVALGLVITTCIVSASGASGGLNTCRAKNVTQGTSATPNLRQVVRDASAGDTVTVRGVCITHLSLSKDLNLIGEPTSQVPTPVLRVGHGVALRFGLSNWAAELTITNLKINGGSHGILNYATLTLQDVVVHDSSTGIASLGALTLNDSVVRDIKKGTGIFNSSPDDVVIPTVVLNGTSTVSGNMRGIVQYEGLTTLNDSSSVIGNVARTRTGGIAIYAGSSLTLNGSASVTGNSTNGNGGGIAVWGTLTLNDSSSVTGNSANADNVGGGRGGGIYVQCGGIVNNATDGGNVNDNYRRTTDPVEDNISYQTACA
jgi:predicted outer membrane repeat protein